MSRRPVSGGTWLLIFERFIEELRIQGVDVVHNPRFAMRIAPLVVPDGFYQVPLCFCQFC